MAYPDLYEITYSYTGFQQAQGDNSFPGTQLDSDLAGLEDSIASLATFLEGVIRSDGKLANASVDFDQLTTGVKASLGNVEAIEEIVDAAATASAAATSATASATTASNAATSASGSASSATSSASSASTSATTATNAATAASASAASANNGFVRMWPSVNQGSGAWNLVDGYGNAISTAGTTTQGLQEAINFAVANGQPLRVTGAGPKQIFVGNGTTHSNTTIDGLSSTSGMLVGDYVTAVSALGVPGFTTITNINSGTSISISNAATLSATGQVRVTRGAGANLHNFIACSSGLIVPPVEQWDAELIDVNITMSPTVNGAGLQFDSCMIVTWKHTGQFVYQPNSPGAGSIAILWAPTKPVPLDGLIGVTGSKFYISNLACPASGGSAAAIWGFNISNGGIDTCEFGSVEMNGTGTGLTANTLCGIQVFGAAASTAFQQNFFDITNIHLVSSAGIQIGVSTSNAASYRGNSWEIGGINTAGASSTGISTFGSKDDFEIGQISNQQGTLNIGITLQSSAGKNTFDVGEITGAATAAVVNGNPGGLNIIRYDANRAPKVTVLTSGSGTFTTQPWTRTMRVRLLGGGAGGAGGGSGSPGTGVAGGNTTFGSSFLTANGGAVQAGAGGSATGGDFNISGGAAGAGVLAGTTGLGGPGGIAPVFGTSSFGVLNGTPTPPGSNSGTGGGGGGSGSSTNPGAGGSAGGFVEKTIVSGLLASYAYAVGAGGTAGAAGTNGQAGAAGAAGLIEVTEYA